MLRCHRLPVILAVVLSLQAFILRAQETPKEPPPPPVPFAAINIASVERVLGDTEFMFRLIDRPDMFEVVKAALSGSAGDLKGLDRTKPFGVLFFLEPGFPPRPMPVGYFPATNMKELMETVGLTEFTPEKVAGKENRYTLGGPGPTQHVQFQAGYAYVTPSEILIDAELPDPLEYNKTLTARYDAAAVLRLTSVPPLMRDVFLGFFRTQTEAQLQRRDDESEGAYKIRRANGLSTLEGLEQLLKEGDQLTIGIDGNQELKKLVIEFNLQALPDSAFAKSMKEFGGRTSYFHTIQSDTDKPLTVSLSTVMDPRDRKVTGEMIEGLRLELDRIMKEQNLDPLASSNLCDVLKATAEEGHLDGFVQIAVPKPGKFIVSGGMKLKGADAAAPAIARLLTDVSTLPEVKGIDINLERHQGVGFSRITPPEEDRGATEFFGEMPAFWFGAGQRAFWFTVGGEEAMPTLKATMDRILTASPPPEGSTVPFILVFRRAKWMSMASNNDPDSPQNVEIIDRRALAREAFNDSNDQIRMETRPTENGVRSRAELDEGFIRWLGLMIVRQFDRSQL